MKRLSCIGNDNDNTDATIWDILWEAVEGDPRALHDQVKQGIEFFFAHAVEGRSDSFHIYTA